MNRPDLDFFERLKMIGAVKPTAPIATPLEKVAVDEEVSAVVSLRNLFFEHEAHPIVLDYALLKAFGTEWFVWEPETIWAEIKRHFHTQMISELTKHKIMAIKTCHVVRSPWMVWQVFEKTIQTFTNIVPNWQIMQAPSVEQLYAGVDIMNHLRQEDFDEEVRLYIAGCLLHEDVFYAPPPLGFVQVELSQPFYKCRDCGHQTNAITSDNYCPNCTDQYAAENGLSFRPDADLVAQGAGKALELHLTYNPTDVEKRWKEVEDKASDQITLKEVPEDAQVSKLLSARDYMNIRRKQLVDQLKSLKSWLGTQ